MTNIDELLVKLNKKIKDLFIDFKGVYLYGSYAGHCAKKNSDVDIVAIFGNELTRKERMDLWGIIGKLEAEMDVVLDLHPTTMAELKQNPIYYNQVVNKGIYYGIWQKNHNW